MPTGAIVMTSDELRKSALPRCVCPVVDDEPVPEMPQIKRCKRCKSWTVLEIITQADSDAVNKWLFT